MRRALVIVGKAPRPGSAKTRLVPPLSHAAAADLYRAFLLDTVELGLSLGWERVTLVHPAGPDQACALDDVLPPTVRRFAQPGHGLGDALSEAANAHFRDGFERVVLMASDSPGLAPEILHQTNTAFDDHDMAIGPTLDGGYYLIGLRRACPGVFQNIDWSTPRVLAQTLERASQHGLRVRTLPEWFDVDCPADLARLHQLLADTPADLAPRTRRALAQLDPR